MANYNSIHTGAEIDAAISQIQILDDSLRGAEVSVTVSTSGSATPADPLNDPFNNVTNAVKWVSENYALVDYLYVEVLPGTYTEGGLHYDPSQLSYRWQAPTNIYHVDIWGLDGVSVTTLDFGGRVVADGDALSRISFSGVKVIADRLLLLKGVESYDSFYFQSSAPATSLGQYTYSTISGKCRFAYDVTFEHPGSTSLSFPSLRLWDASIDMVNVDTLTLDSTRDVASGRLAEIRRSFVDMEGVSVVNASTNSLDIYVGRGATLVEPLSLTNCTTTFDNNSIPTRAQAALL